MLLWSAISGLLADQAHTVILMYTNCILLVMLVCQKVPAGCIATVLRAVASTAQLSVCERRLLDGRRAAV